MDKTQQELLKLLQCALWDKPCDAISVDVLRDVMKLSQAHTVDGLVAGVFIDNKVLVEDSLEKEDMLMDLVSKDTLHKRAYVRYSGVVAELESLMTRNNIPYFVFKGTAVASHYPKPYRRTMGDVDFYVSPQDIKRTIGVLEEEWKVRVAEGESEKHLSFTYKSIPFELHHRVETFGSAKHQLLFDNLISEGVRHTDTYKVDGGSARMLPPEEDIITVFKHMFNHLLVEGVGLRQVVDVAVLLNDYRHVVDISVLKERMPRIGYLKAFSATVTMLGDYLGLPCASYYAAITDNGHKWGRRIINFIMESGNFGRSAYKNKTASLSRSAETARHAFRHILTLSPLIPSEVPGIIWKHTNITIRKYTGK